MEAVAVMVLDPEAEIMDVSSTETTADSSTETIEVSSGTETIEVSLDTAIMEVSGPEIIEVSMDVSDTGITIVWTSVKVDDLTSTDVGTDGTALLATEW